MQENIPSEGLISIESPFLVEESAWYNLKNSIFSNHLPLHIVHTVILMILEAILTSPLSLFVTVPMLYFAIQVSNSGY